MVRRGDASDIGGCHQLGISYPAPNPLVIDLDLGDGNTLSLVGNDPTCIPTLYRWLSEQKLGIVLKRAVALPAA